jgi:hypothetical protein
MPIIAPHHRSLAVFVIAVLLAAPALRALPATADPVPGFTEHWPFFSGDGWGGSDFYTNPGTGGVLGASDGFLTITTPGPAPSFKTNLGAMSGGPEYMGNWIAAGIVQVKFWLQDVGNPDPLEVHFCIGNDTNFWQYNTGFIPPAGSWSQFTVDLTSAANWTQIINHLGAGGTYDSALKTVDRVLIRHDHAPFTQNPDTIRADLGVDELMLVGGSTGVPGGGPAVARPVDLAAPWPNPSRGPVTFAFQSFDRSPVQIVIVDAAGREVRRARIESGMAGPQVWTWDGLTDRGGPAPSGYFRVRAFSAAGGTSRPLVHIAK